MEREDLIKLERKMINLRKSGDLLGVAEIMTDIVEIYKKIGEKEQAQKIINDQNSLIIHILKEMQDLFNKLQKSTPITYKLMRNLEPFLKSEYKSVLKGFCKTCGHRLIPGEKVCDVCGNVNI